LVRILHYKSKNLSLTFDTEVKGGLVLGVVHPDAMSFFAGPNILTKSEAGLHRCPQQAKVKALPRIKLCWTGRDRAMSYPLDNPQNKTPFDLFKI
jgi:hypothetical protein